MPILQLPKGTTDELATIPEAAMGLQAVQISDMAVLVVGGQIAILPDDSVSEQLTALSERMWIRDGKERGAQISDFDNWLSTLPMAQNVTFSQQQPLKAILGFILHGPVGPLPPPPLGPAYAYGHLQFHGTTQANDIFYRYEPFPTSRRINQATKTIAADTFAAPESEMPLTPLWLFSGREIRAALSISCTLAMGAETCYGFRLEMRSQRTPLRTIRRGSGGDVCSQYNDARIHPQSFRARRALKSSLDTVWFCAPGFEARRGRTGTYGQGMLDIKARPFR